jgi:Domain of unknown function (DUF4190)/DUF1707 SHOCT-like domain
MRRGVAVAFRRVLGACWPGLGPTVRRCGHYVVAIGVYSGECYRSREALVAVDPASDSTSDAAEGNGATRRYGADSGYGAVSGYDRGAVYPSPGPAAGPPAMPSPGMMGRGAAGPPGMLAANTDRERAIDVLKAGFAEGRLTQAEYNDRVARVYASRTYGELGVIVGDLPAGPLGGPSHYQAAWYPPAPVAQSTTNSMAVAALICGLGEFFTMGLTAIPAVIFGHVARKQVRETGQRGDGMALAGLILGWAAIGLFAAVMAGLIVAATVTSHVHNIQINTPGGGPPFPGGGG